MPAGRPSLYSPELAAQICEIIATTTQGLETICEADDSLPASRTFRLWLAKYPDLMPIYLRARESQADIIFDECLPIADDGRNDTYTDEQGNKRVDQDVIARSKLRVDTRMRMAGKLAPKKYGDAPAAVNVAVGVGVTVMTEDRRAELMAKKQAAIDRRLAAQGQLTAPARE